MLRRVAVLVGLITGMALTTVPAAQSAVFVNASDPLTGFAVFIPCANGGAGEIVILNGQLHTLITFTVNGNHFSGSDHFQPQGLSGVGTVTGDKYQGTGVTQDQFGGSLVNGGFEQSFINNFRMIGQGPGNNFLVHESFHMTVNANGAVTVVHDNFSVECK